MAPVNGQVVPAIAVTPTSTATAVNAPAIALGLGSLSGLAPYAEYTYSLQPDTGYTLTACADLGIADMAGKLLSTSPPGLLVQYTTAGAKTVVVLVYSKASCGRGAMPKPSTALVAQGTASIMVCGSSCSAHVL